MKTLNFIRTLLIGISAVASIIFIVDVILFVAKHWTNSI